MNVEQTFQLKLKSINIYCRQGYRGTKVERNLLIHNFVPFKIV